MVVTFGQIVDHARRFDADASTKYTDEMYQDLVGDAVNQVWNARAWPFHISEHPFVTYAPYDTGTLSLTNGSTKAVVSAAATWSVSWPDKSRLFVDDVPSDYLVSDFRQSGTDWVATMDLAWHSTTGGGHTYLLEFPTYELPSDFRELDQPYAETWWSTMTPISYQEWMHRRISGAYGTEVSAYAIQPTDGTEPNRILFHPPPASQVLVRVPYRKRAPSNNYWSTGSVSFGAGKRVNGSGTLWGKTGFALAGLYIEHERVQGVVSTATVADGTLSLTTAWGGQRGNGKSYHISSGLEVPEYILPPMRAAARAAVAKMRRNPNLELLAEREKDRLITQAAAAAHAQVEPRMKQPGSVEGGMVQPGLPKIVVRSA